jgi:hypothetical protein
MPGTQPIASGATPPSFAQSYPSEQSVTINSALIDKLNQRLISRGSDLRLSFNDLTWANISIALYGTAAFASQLAAMNGGGSGPSVNEPDWVTDFMCAIDDDYCWETYAEASIRVPSNQNLDQFLSAQPAQPTQPAQPAQPPVIAPPIQPPPPPVQQLQPTQPTQPAQPIQPQLRITFVNFSVIDGDPVATFRSTIDLAEAGVTSDNVQISNCEGVVDRDVEVSGKTIKVYFNIGASAGETCSGTITVKDRPSNFRFNIPQE